MNKLDTVTSILASIAAVAVLGQVAYSRFAPPQSVGGTGRRADTQALVGKELTLSNELVGGEEATVILAISTTCHFCTESAPFYKRLGGIRSASPHVLRLVAVLPQNNRDATEYLGNEGVAVDQVLSIPLMSLKVRGTPTVFLLDSHKQVRSVWSGKLSSAREADLVAALKLICPHCISPPADGVGHAGAGAGGG